MSEEYWLFRPANQRTTRLVNSNSLVNWSLDPEYGDFRIRRSLQLMRCPISDVTPLAGLTQLESLDLDGTHVTAISPLVSLSRLTRIDVRGFPSELDLTPLSNLPRRATVSVSRGAEHRGLDSIRDRGHTIELV